MTISVEKARSLVRLANTRGSDGEIDAALEVYVEACNEHGKPLQSVELIGVVETWHVGDRVRLTGRSWGNCDVDGVTGTVDVTEDPEGFIAVKLDDTSDGKTGVLVKPEQLTRI